MIIGRNNFVQHTLYEVIRYLAERILRQNGYTNVKNLTGGFKTYDHAIRERELLKNREVVTIKKDSATIDYLNEDGSFRKRTENKILKIDACGLQCPGPIIRLKKEIDNLEQGDRIIVSRITSYNVCYTKLLRNTFGSIH